MVAIDFIKDRRFPRKRLPDLFWTVKGNVLFLEETSGSLREVGALDWTRTRFLEQELWAWASGSYHVLDKTKEIGRPPEKVYTLMPSSIGATPGAEDDD